MNRRVRFDDEADAEYRSAGRWYEARREHLGLEFFDAVDAAIDQIVAMPDAGPRVRRIPADLVVRRRAVTRFPYHVCTSTWRHTSESLLSHTTGESPVTGRTA